MFSFFFFFLPRLFFLEKIRALSFLWIWPKNYFSFRFPGFTVSQKKTAFPSLFVISLFFRDDPN